MNRWHRAIDYCCVSLMQSAHRYARILGVINSELRIVANHPERPVQFSRPSCRSRVLTFTVRVLALIVFWLAHMEPLHAQLRQRTLDGYFAALPVLSVGVLALLALAMQLRLETYGECTVNAFINIFHEVRAHMGVPTLFCSRYFTWLMLKVLCTLLGFVDELPTLLAPPGHGHGNGHDTALMLLSRWCGVYLWLGSILLLDFCYVGFVTSGAIYSNLGQHLCAMVRRMKAMGGRVARRNNNSKLSDYQRMQLLCKCADHLDACNALWARLYLNTLRFHVLFEWQTLYYLLYNFCQILMLLHRTICTYLQAGVIEVLPPLMIAVKLGNLSLLIMCVDAVLRKARVADSLPLDLIYSGVDARWDRAVESFYARRHVENLRFFVLGYFELRNELVPLVLSAILSYLFILIQFGVETSYMPGSRNANYYLQLSHNASDAYDNNNTSSNNSNNTNDA